MIKNYTYQDWENDLIIDLPKDNRVKNEYFRALSKAGFLSTEDLEKIINKQSWVYDNALEINEKAYINILKYKLSSSPSPIRHLEIEKEKIQEKVNEDKFLLERVLELSKDYLNIRGSDYLDVKKILEEGNPNSTYLLLCHTFENGKWVPNRFLEVDSLLAFENRIRNKTVEEILDMEKQNVPNSKKAKRGRKTDERLTIERTKDFFEQFKASDTVQSVKFHSDGTVNKYQLIKFILDKDTGVSESTIERRVDELFKMGS